jgi:hypothetical protein
MGFVALVALNLVAIRASDEFRAGMMGDLLIMGAMPMANFLAVSTLIRHQRHGSHPFLLGFEAFGTMALVFYVALVSNFPKQVWVTCVAPWSNPILKSNGWHWPYVHVPMILTVTVVILGLPQVVFALIGGLVFRRFNRQSVNFSR